MNINEEQRKSFEEAAKPMIQWLNEHCHPHVSVNVDCTSAELSEGVCRVDRTGISGLYGSSFHSVTEEYLRD